mgnify:CR=1 FL=1
MKRSLSLASMALFFALAACGKKDEASPDAPKGGSCNKDSRAHNFLRDHPDLHAQLLYHSHDMGGPSSHVLSSTTTLPFRKEYPNSGGASSPPPTAAVRLSWQG